MNEEPKPKMLYKFRSWSDDYHKTLLMERKLWVPKAADLNDPFDCDIPYRYDLMPPKDLAKRLRQLLGPGLSREQKREKVRKRIQELGIRDKARKGRALEELARRNRDKYGVLSFSTVRDVPLLWSHYAQAYRGFCVGVDPDQFLEVLKEYFYNTEKPFQEAWVKYVNEFPTIIPSSDEDEDLDKYLELFTTKSVYWEHEKEYRYVFADAGRFNLILGPDCVSEVILGSEMPEAHKEEVLKIARYQFPTAQLLQARRKFDSFELEFVPV